MYAIPFERIGVTRFTKEETMISVDSAWCYLPSVSEEALVHFQILTPRQPFMLCPISPPRQFE
jgi:hypothetical protein